MTRELDMTTTNLGCDACKRHDLGILEQVGDTERSEFLGGDNIEDQTHFRCTLCGVSWTRIKERGAGSRGTFWTPQ